MESLSDSSYSTKLFERECVCCNKNVACKRHNFHLQFIIETLSNLTETLCFT